MLKDVTTGKNVTITKPVNLYGCELYDDVFVGPFVEIQKDNFLVLLQSNL